MAKQKYYVVWKGKSPGIYHSWDDCKLQVSGYKGAKYQSFSSYALAKEAFANTSGPLPKQRVQKVPLFSNSGPVLQSISVDAACSGNPGLMEYQGVNTQTKEQIFHAGPYQEGTNNIGEFLAIVHGLQYLKALGSDQLIYTDSVVAIGWIKKKHCKTTLTKNARNATLFEAIEQAERWLKEESFRVSILKWETKTWGEVPADFGRK